MESVKTRMGISIRGFAVPFTVAGFCRVKPGTSSRDAIQYGGRNRSVVRNCCNKLILLATWDAEPIEVHF